jgi:cytochrome b pre-mRNA-processing protein 3
MGRIWELEVDGGMMVGSFENHNGRRGYTNWGMIDLGLKPTFSTWSQVTMVHIYMLSSRFRSFEAPVCRIWQQHLIDHFFYDMENKMAVDHGMVARGTRNKYLKDVFLQWRGVLAAYDEGLTKNDAVLAGALWRNVFKASEDVDFKKLAMIVSFVRESLNGLSKVTDEQIMKAGWSFGSPADEAGVVARKSQELEEATSKGPAPKPLPAKAAPVKKK